VEEASSRLVGCNDARPQALRSLLARPALLVLQLEADLACEPLGCLRKRQALDLLHEAVDVSAFLASEAMPQALGFVHRERRRLLGVKRAQAFESVSARFLQI
jgi:hypothetical protein